MGRALTSSLSIPSLLHAHGLSSASHAVSQCLYLSLLYMGRGTDLQPQHSLPSPSTRSLICQPCSKSVPLSLSLVHWETLTSSLSIPSLLHPHGLLSTSSHAIGQYSSLFYLGWSLASSLSIPFLLYAPTRPLILPGEVTHLEPQPQPQSPLPTCVSIAPLLRL